MNKNNIELKCLSPCYNFKNNPGKELIHPFIGLSSFNLESNTKICLSDYNKIDNTTILNCKPKDSTIDIQTSSNNTFDIVNTLMSPIKTIQFLSVYYNINDISDVVNYFKTHINLIEYSKIRILDLVIFTYNMTFEIEINNWIELLQIIYNNNKLTEQIIIKILKKIQNKYDLNNEKIYPLDFYLKIKKYLEQ